MCARRTAEDDKDRIGSQISNINSRLHVIQARNKESEDKRKSLQTRVAVRMAAKSGPC